MAENGEILEFLVGQCSAFHFSDEWARFKPPSDYFQVPSEPGVLLAALLERYSPEDLGRSGACRINKEGGLVLHPGLSNPSSTLVELRPAAGKMPFELLTGRGCLTASRLPACAALEDDRYKNAHPDRKNRLHVTFSVSDMAVLTIMGFPATIAAGLARLGRKSLEQFCECFGLRRRHEQAYLGESRPSLVLVGWSPSQLDIEEPKGFRAVYHHVLGLQNHLHIEMDDIEVWKPTPQEVARIRFSVNHGTGRDVGEAFQSSMDSSSVLGVAQLARREREGALDYATAVADWRCASDDRCRQEKAWKMVQQIQERDLVEPLLRHAENTGSPLDRNLTTAMANITRLLHPLALRMAQDYAIALAKGGNREDLLLPDKEFQQLLAMTDRLRALTQERKPWRHKKKPLMNRRTKPVNPSSAG